MTPMTKKRKRRERLILILIVLSRSVADIDGAVANNVYSGNENEEDLSSAELGLTEAIDNYYLAFDPGDDPDNFDENGLLPEVDPSPHTDAIEAALILL